MTGLANSHSGTSAPWDLATRVSSLWPSFIANTPLFDFPAERATPADTVGNANSLPRLTTPSPVVPLHGTKERVKVRFRLLRRLQDDHDNEGARAANKASVDAAIAFVDSLSNYPPFFATLDDDGSAVIEFEDKATGFFADLTFKGNNVVECYRRATNSPSLSFGGLLTDEALRERLSTELRIAFC
jgi:hypothetical protein